MGITISRGSNLKKPVRKMVNKINYSASQQAQLTKIAKERLAENTSGNLNKVAGTKVDSELGNV